MKNKNEIIGSLMKNVTFNINDKGTIIMNIPEKCFDEINSSLNSDHGVELEPLSEEIKLNSTPAIIHNFDHARSQIINDEYGRHIEIYMTKARYLHIWIDQLDDENTDKYKICTNLSDVYSKMCNSYVSDLHTYIWDDNIINGTIEDLSHEDEASKVIEYITEIIWDDVFIHYATKGDNGWRIECKSFKEWYRTYTTRIVKILQHEKNDRFNYAKEVNTFIAEIATINFNKLREKGIRLPDGTFFYRK